MKILVTGANGYIGLHIVKTFISVRRKILRQCFNY